jgi:hypothetical protein
MRLALAIVALLGLVAVGVHGCWDELPFWDRFERAE